MRAKLAALSMGLLAGCSVTLPNDPPDLEGTILVWNVPFPGENEFHLRLTVADQGCVHETFISDDTDFALRRPGGSLKSATFRDLEIGQAIRVWTKESMPSCPGDSSAEAVEVLLE